MSKPTYLSFIGLLADRKSFKEYEICLPISESRRQALRALFAAGTALCVPGKAKAIDPITVLTAAAAVVGIVSGLAGMASDASLRNGINMILSKLDVVIANQELLLEELRSLKIYIDEALRRSWRDAYARNIASYNDSLEVYFADLKANKWSLNKRLREDFEDLSKDCANTTFSIGQMDVWAYPSFATGVIVVILSDRILRTSPQRVAETNQKFVKYIDQWLNPESSKSLPVIIAQTLAELLDRTNKLNTRQRTYVLTDRRVNTGGGDPEVFCTEHVVEQLSVSGTLEAGFNGTISTTRDDKRCRVFHDTCSGRRCLMIIDSDVAGVEEGIARRKDGISVFALTDEPIAIPVVPGFTPSGYSIVDEFNRERVAIFELMAINARQKQLQQEMNKMRKALS